MISHIESQCISIGLGISNDVKSLPSLEPGYTLQKLLTAHRRSIVTELLCPKTDILIRSKDDVLDDIDENTLTHVLEPPAPPRSFAAKS